MKVLTVRYSRLHGLPNYCSVKASVEIQVDEGEDPDEAMQAAKDRVHSAIKVEITNLKQGE